MSPGDTTAALRVPEGVAPLLRDLIHQRTGIFFEDHSMELLLGKLEPLARSRGCASFLDYYYALKDDELGEWDRAWEALSVQETYFWREMSQINALVEKIIPPWFQKKQLPFRIWSAACATGEEPYSIAIALQEHGLGAYPIEILGTDASPAALQKAQQGVYGERSFRALPLALRHKYFSHVSGGAKLSAEIMNRVSFRRANLLDPADVSHSAYAQAIFCRNVFIYFSRHSIRQTVAMMAIKMPPGAYLFIGASESLLKLTTDFDLRQIGDAFVYVRI